MPSETFVPDLIAAREEIGCLLVALPGKLRRQSALPRELPSRRSFCRAWGETLHETPPALLRRLRLRSAKRI
jgi:hypothetical protein